MLMPSMKSLAAAFPTMTRESFRQIRRIGHAVDDASALETIIATECPATQRYVQSLYSSPYDSHMWRVTVALHAMDVIMGTHGVEGFGPGGAFDGPAYEYLNAGDTYATTLVYHRRADAVRIGCWGDIAERHLSYDE